MKQLKHVLSDYEVLFTERTTLYKSDSSNNVFVKKYYSNPSIEIYMNDKYDDLALIPLIAKKKGINEPVIWTHDLSDDMVMIDGTTLRFLKHYEGIINLTASAGDYTDEKSVEIICSTVPSSIEYRVTNPPQSPIVEWDSTSTELSFVGEIIAHYENGHKPDEIIESTYTFNAEFEKNEPYGDNPMQFTLNTEYIDLGLPSGLKWAKCNLGAQSETEDGAYFQYGDIYGYAKPTDKGGLSVSRTITGTYMWNGIGVNYEITQNGLEHRGFSWYNAPFNNGETTYNSEYFESIKDDVCPNNILASNFDAATFYGGNDCRIPTLSDINELVNNTNIEVVVNFNDTGINGTKFINKEDSSKYIFIPVSGVFLNTNHKNYTQSGYYWSSSLNPSNHNHSYYMFFLIGSAVKYRILDDGNRSDGFPIRCVHL